MPGLAVEAVPDPSSATFVNLSVKPTGKVRTKSFVMSHYAARLAGS